MRKSVTRLKPPNNSKRIYPYKRLNIMESKEATITVMNLQAEIDRLKKDSFFKDKKIRELEREINDYVKREKELMDEISSMELEITTLSTSSPKPVIEAKSVEEFLNPKLSTGTGMVRTGVTGFENSWEDFMYAYSDQIFIDADTPDTLLFRDDSERCYVTPTGNTRLPFPILPEDLERLNFLKVRPLTEKEIKSVCDEYNL